MSGNATKHNLNQMLCQHGQVRDNIGLTHSFRNQPSTILYIVNLISTCKVSGGDSNRMLTKRVIVEIVRRMRPTYYCRCAYSYSIYGNPVLSSQIFFFLQNKIKITEKKSWATWNSGSAQKPVCPNTKNQVRTAGEEWMIEGTNEWMDEWMNGCRAPV